MRGFVTMATAFALPESFPQRDTVVLTAFCVVLATLVLQGLTLAPLVRLLKLDRREDADRELTSFQVKPWPGRPWQASRERMDRKRKISGTGSSSNSAAAPRETGADSLERLRGLSLTAIEAMREELEGLRIKDEIGPEEYLGLQEQLDWNELTSLSDDDRKMEEI